MKLIMLLVFFMSLAHTVQNSGIQKDELVEKILSGADDLPTEAFGLAVGDVINISSWEWVEVVEPDRYKGEYGIDQGDDLKILGFSPDGQLVLVENSNNLPGRWIRGAGVSVPKDALFLVSVEELAEWEDKSIFYSIKKTIQKFL